MLCENCNYILTGKENFCPNCASAVRRERLSRLQETDVEKNAITKKEDSSEKGFVFQKKEDDVQLKKDKMNIFYDYAQDDEQEQVVKKKSAAGKIFVLLMILCVLTVGVFAVADYFNLTSSVFGFLRTAVTDNVSTTVNFDHQSSVLAPEINCTPCIAYVMSGKGLTLRKGPGNSYAPLKKLTELTCVEIRGESITEKTWVYVYCGEAIGYGWLDGSFLARDKEQA